MRIIEDRKGGLQRILVFGGSLLLVGAISVQVAAKPPRNGYARGEVERLLRQSYDYYYRNSNHNVFRSSRHFHPTRNVFRSSRYYQQRLAASYDGYPLRTTIRYGTNRGRARGPLRERTISFAHPRRSPQGPVGFGYDLLPVSDYGAPYPHDLLDYDRPTHQSIQPVPILKPRPRTRSEIDMVEVSVSPREPTQTAVLQTVTLADGSSKAIITSEPIDAPVESLDGAWKLMAVGDHSRAAEAFLELALDETLGPEAMLGYGLARALDGEEDVARNSIARALVEDPDLPERIKLDDAQRALLERLRAAMDESSAESRE